LFFLSAGGNTGSTETTTTSSSPPPSPNNNNHPSLPPSSSSSTGGSRGGSRSVTTPTTTTTAVEQQQQTITTTPSSGQQPIQGTPLSIFQLPSSTMKEISEISLLGKPGVSTIRFSMDDSSLHETTSSSLPCYCKHLEKEAAFICKKCQLAFPTESTLLGHQRIVCYPGKAASNLRGAIRLVQQGFECKACNERMSSYHELKLHCTTELHLGHIRLQEHNNTTNNNNRQSSLSPTEGLSHEMEDVVNQITALAAQAAAADTPTTTTNTTRPPMPNLEAGSVTG
jgi:hypothetical protein